MADKTLNAEALRKQTVEDLELRLEESKRDGFRLRVRATTKELVNTTEIKNKRREVARILTILNEKSKASADSAK
ncbi:MAG: 50S ribosomal protein L29 [Sumerlaeia bacterium]